VEKWIRSLIETLRQTETMYARLLKLIEDEIQSALAADIVQLNMIGIEKQNLISQLEEADQQRAQVLRHLADALSIPRADLTVSRLTEIVDSADNDQLLELQQRLIAVVAQVRHSNEQCRLLVSHCLRLVHNSLGFFQHWIGTTKVYGAAGDFRNKRPDSGRLLSDSV
jgi:flagellar biosynthesis/type III secretory pathway chaperone